MDANELRLECLRLAQPYSVVETNPDEVVATAKMYLDFIVGESQPAAKPVAQPRGADGRFVKSAAAKTMADLVDSGQLTGDPEFDAETDRLWDEHVAQQGRDAGELHGSYADNLNVKAPTESEASFMRRCFGRF